MSKNTKLTPPQLVVLRNTADGQVYRSERCADLYDCYDLAQNRKKVTAIVHRLSQAGLIEIAPEHDLQRQWKVTEAGFVALLQAGVDKNPQ